MKLMSKDIGLKTKEYFIFTGVNENQIKSKIEVIDDVVTFDIENEKDVEKLLAIKTIEKYKKPMMEKIVKKSDDMEKVIIESDDMKKVIPSKKEKNKKSKK